MLENSNVDELVEIKKTVRFFTILPFFKIKIFEY
jgi:hypothetical protein